jgi:hypothetical protein
MVETVDAVLDVVLVENPAWRRRRPEPLAFDCVVVVICLFEGVFGQRIIMVPAGEVRTLLKPFGSILIVWQGLIGDLREDVFDAATSLPQPMIRLTTAFMKLPAQEVLLQGKS